MLFTKYPYLGLDDYNAGIYAMLENVDTNIHRIQHKLEELHLLEDTIVIFLSDNGANMFPPLFTRYNSNLRGFKGTVYEGGTRVPMFIQWKGHLEAGTKREQIGAHIDLFPTIFELCGLPLPETKPLDGKSLVPLLKNKEFKWSNRAIFTHMHSIRLSNEVKSALKLVPGMIVDFIRNFRRVRKNPKLRGQKLIRSAYLNRKDNHELFFAPGAVRTSQYRLAVFPDKDELYAVAQDPTESRNLIDVKSDVASRLRDLYDEWFDSFRPENNWVKEVRIPIGYDQAPKTVLRASHAQLKGDLHFAGFGFYHDWITHWKTIEDSISWDLEIMQQGTYEIKLEYSCRKKYMGSTIVIEVGEKRIEFVLDAPHYAQIITRPDKITRVEQPERKWALFEAGQLNLTKGKKKLKIYAKDIRKKKVMDLFSIHVLYKRD